ncbi:hypothetical protein Tco_1122910 [Tanacetum coccineum]|uniref:RNase H type-1 domain-containing protein n=1 Tax=Tanacetum coccineum TaxID=301880 RepID=A0ABQ5J1Y4_9ASTR
MASSGSSDITKSPEGSRGWISRGILYLMIKSFRSSGSPSEHPKDKSGLAASAKLTRVELNKRSGDADLSKDKSGPESPPEFRRSWYVEGHIRSGVISSVLAQQHLSNSPTKGIVLGDEGPSSRGTKLNSTFITVEVPFTKYKQPTLAKWVIELRAYDIQYAPRVAVKGQILTDFLSNTSMEINVAPVRLYTDGASNIGGSRAGLILIAPDDVEHSYALRLNFSYFNNDVKYKALIARQRIATEMQEKVLELAGAFNRFRITHILRAENKKPDALSKLTTVQFDHLSKEVLVEELNHHSIEVQEVNMVVEEEGPVWMTPI